MTTASHPEFNRTPSSFGNSPQPEKNQPKSKVHVIADIRWARGVKPEHYGEAPIVCTCGWHGRADAYADHRAATMPPPRQHIKTRDAR